MLEAIREKLEAEEARAAFHAGAKRRLQRMKKTGTAIPAADVFEYVRRRAVRAAARRPKSRKIAVEAARRRPRAA
jgi:hypothetical protein